MLANSAVTIIDAVGNSAVISSGSTSSPAGLMVAGSDGAVARFLLTDGAGRQFVTGSIGVSNFPALQAITGSVGVTGSVAITNVVTVTGSFGSTDSVGRTLVVGPIVSGSTAQGNPLIFAGVDTSNLAGTGSIVRTVAVDSSGRIITAPAGSNTLNGFAYGTITTSATTNVPLRETVYNEQAVNAQRSMSSANAADSSAGTGARQVKITYYDQTFAGPFTETVTLNGVTAVNTTNTNICYIEKMTVMSVGSGGVNAGVITLFIATAGGGGTLGTIAASDNQTFWAHHYVPSFKTTYITSYYGNNNNGSNNTLFSIAGRLSGSTAPLTVISDAMTGGGGGSPIARNFGTPVAFAGPGRIVMYAAPAGTPTIISRGSFDYYDQ